MTSSHEAVSHLPAEKALAALAEGYGKICARLTLSASTRSTPSTDCVGVEDPEGTADAGIFSLVCRYIP
jgi:hypothetical protein